MTCRKRAPRIRATASDGFTVDGKESYDEDHMMYLHNSWPTLQRATAEGIRVKGNFVWSAFDNLS